MSFFSLSICCIYAVKRVDKQLHYFFLHLLITSFHVTIELLWEMFKNEIFTFSCIICWNEVNLLLCSLL